GARMVADAEGSFTPRGDGNFSVAHGFQKQNCFFAGMKAGRAGDVAGDASCVTTDHPDLDLRRRVSFPIFFDAECRNRPNFTIVPHGDIRDCLGADDCVRRIRELLQRKLRESGRARQRGHEEQKNAAHSCKNACVQSFHDNFTSRIPVAVAMSPLGVVMKRVRRPAAVWVEIDRVSSTKLGNRPDMEAVLMPMSPPVWGALNVYVNVGSRKFPCTQMFSVCVPEAGRVTSIGEAWIVHVEPSGETMPTKSTLTGEVVAPAVVASGTMMSSPVGTGFALLSEMTEGAAGAESTMRCTGFESSAAVPGF